MGAHAREAVGGHVLGRVTRGWFARSGQALRCGGRRGGDRGREQVDAAEVADHAPAVLGADPGQGLAMRTRQQFGPVHPILCLFSRICGREPLRRARAPVVHRLLEPN